MVDVQDGPNKVHFWKACSLWEDSTVANAFVKIRYCIRHSEIHQG